tara:strand:- start:687 stop:920 length:234 start_codon:yes stop_codon:yes gene_type:complete
MKITKSQLKQIIKEELNEQFDAELTPEQQQVEELCYQLVDALGAMGRSNPNLTDAYVNLFRALKSAGVAVDRVAMLA